MEFGSNMKMLPAKHFKGKEKIMVEESENFPKRIEEKKIKIKKGRKYMENLSTDNKTCLKKKSKY